MAKYLVKFSCGHEEEMQIFGKCDDRARKIEYFERNGLCSCCYHNEQAAKMQKEFDEVEMSYRDYKNNYANCKTKYDSYNKETKTIIVYIPKQVETAEKVADTTVKAETKKKVSMFDVRAKYNCDLKAIMDIVTTANEKGISVEDAVDLLKKQSPAKYSAVTAK